VRRAPPLLSALRASRFGPSGLKLSPPNPKTKLRPWEVGNLPDQSKYGCYGPEAIRKQDDLLK